MRMLGLGRKAMPYRPSPLVAAANGRSLGIANAGFDGVYHPQDGISVLHMAPGWRGVWQHGTEAHHGFLVRPEFYEKELGPSWSPKSDVCQGVQSTSATHRAAVVQAINLPLGARNIRVEAMVAYYAPKGGMAATIGLDGTGQTRDITASTIRWSNYWLDQDNGWNQETWATVVAELTAAETGTMSIWLKSENRWRGKNNHVFWRQVTGTCTINDDDVEPPGDCELPKQLLVFMDYVYDALEEIKEHLALAAATRVQGGNNG